MAKNHQIPSFSSLRKPICEDIDPYKKPVSLQMGYEEPSFTCFSIEKNREDQIESP
jgi:hypothetical protein